MLLPRILARPATNSVQAYTKYVSRKLHYDVVIVGGGVMGSSSAFFLKHKAPSMKIAVIEKDMNYTKASSSLSVGGIREQFTTPENIKLSYWSRNFMNNMKSYLSINDETPDISLFDSSYMFLSTECGADILKCNAEIQQSCGVKIKCIPANEIHQYYDWVNTDGIAGANIYFGNMEGSFDGWSLLQAFKKKAENIGVDYIKGECLSIDASSKVNGLTVANEKGEPIELECSSLVNASGPWAGELMQKIDVHLPVTPRKRFVYTFDCPKGPGRNAPLTIDPTGVYFKPDGQTGTRFLCGCSPCEDEEPDTSNLDVDYDYFESFIWPVLAERYRGMEELKLYHSWAGYYDFNTLDQNCIIGPHNELDNLYFINGFSGHGIQQSPAAGNAISELIIDGQFKDVDLTRFGYQRIADNEPLLEINVV